MITLALFATLVLSQDLAGLPETTLSEVVVEGRPREGRVTLSCLVQSDGSMDECRVVSETPRGGGFGEAALESARRARLTPDTVRQGGRGARVTFTMRFTEPVPGDAAGAEAPNP